MPKEKMKGSKHPKLASKASPSNRPATKKKNSASNPRSTTKQY
jgi:hypothetical protein